MMIPRIVIAGTHSGCGKTTIASGIMGALTARYMTVQPFKVGPDFIDPSHHTHICGRHSRNLDPFMMGEDGVLDSFTRACEGADIAVIEGVMGMFDGVDGSDLSSTAHVARLLQAPVILVVDAQGMSRSVHALIKGFLEFDPTITIAGVIVNKRGSDRHQRMIESGLAVPSFGWIPKREDIKVKSRHLGLLMAHESGSMTGTGKVIEEYCDLEAIVRVASLASDLRAPSVHTPHVSVRATIGVAMDPAFCFYYQDNLDRLRDCGANLVFFSPIADRLPVVDAVYLGGGYPELHLPELESSICTKELKDAVDQGMPVYAECGGLIYLSREIFAEKTYRMCGILPAQSDMTTKIQALGYVRGESAGNGSFLLPAGQIRGHEFHYSRTNPDRDARYAFSLSRGKGIYDGNDGLISANAIGSYTHVYFSQKFADLFIDAAANFRK
ncbi:MAG: cobyrinate a,c-diamide synthase [Methanoregula sp.]|nr:cobyrinate a,c-diamide synthase [Methanoregula sp.]